MRRERGGGARGGGAKRRPPGGAVGGGRGALRGSGTLLAGEGPARRSPPRQKTMAGAVGALGIPSAAPTGRSTGGGRRRRAARPAAAASRRGRAGLPFRRLAEPERAPSRLDRDFDSIVPLATSSGGFGAGPSALDAAAVEAALVAAAPAARLALASPSFSSPPRASPPCPLATAALGLLVAEVASPPPDAPHLPPSPSPLPPRLRDAAVVVALARASLPALAAAARALRDAGPSPGVVTFSPKVFVPLTRLCRDRCGYCEFAVPPPAGPGSPRPAGAASPRLFLTPDEAVALARAGAAAGCREVLLTLGDAPEERWPEARRELEGGRLGGRAWGSTMDYLCHVASRVARETGLLPHANPGEMSRRDAARLMEAGCVSLGAMLETTREPAALPATVHPDVDAATSKPLAGTKRPARRLATLVNAGRAGAPTTTGLLVGIGETPADVVASLLAVRAADDACGGHVQECIVQPFAPKPGTPMADARPCAPERLWWACAAARLILGAAATVQSPPNLAPPPAAAPAGPGEGDGDATLLLALGALLDHGVNDWGGVSPLTPDHVSPRRPWPRLAALAAAGAERGLALAPRLAVGPGWLVQRGGLESEGLEGAAGAGHGARPGRRDGPRPDWGGGDPAPGAPPPDGGGWPGAAERATLAAAAAERWTRWGGWLSNAPLPGGGDPSASSRAGAGLPPPRPSARALALALSDADGLGRGGGAPVPPDGGGCGDAGVVGASPTDEDAPFGPLSDAWHAGLAEGESGSASPAAASAAAAAAAAATSPSPSRPADATEGGRPAPGALPPGVVRPSWRLRVSVPGEAVEGGEVGSAAGSAADSAPLYRGGAPAPRRPPPPHSQTATPALAAALRRVTDSIEAHDGTRPAPSAASLLGPSALSPPGRAEGSRTPSGSPWLPNAPLTPLSSLPPAPHVVDVARLLSARGSSDLGALISAADAVRAAAAARHRSQDSRDSQDHHSRADIPEDAASYVANRNINYTNVCGLQCAFCESLSLSLSLSLTYTHSHTSFSLQTSRRPFLSALLLTYLSSPPQADSAKTRAELTEGTGTATPPTPFLWPKSRGGRARPRLSAAPKCACRGVSIQTLSRCRRSTPPSTARSTPPATPTGRARGRPTSRCAERAATPPRACTSTPSPRWRFGRERGWGRGRGSGAAGSSGPRRRTVATPSCRGTSGASVRPAWGRCPAPPPRFSPTASGPVCARTRSTRISGSRRSPPRTGRAFPPRRR